MQPHPVASPLLKICRKPPLCVSPDATVAEATRLMVEGGVGAVAVVEEDALVGVLTERDLMVKIVDPALDPSDVRVATVMATEVRSVGPGATHGEAATLMLTHHCRHLPVVDDQGKILGMLSIRHLYREQLHRLRGQMDSLESYILADGPGG